MPVITLVSSTYQAESENAIGFAGLSDVYGVPLVPATGSAKLAIFDVAGLYRASGVAMAYTGTPGSWNYTGPSSDFPDGTLLLLTVAGYDPTGVTLYVSQDVLCTPVAPTLSTYSRGSINVFTFPAFGPPGGALLDNTASQAQITITNVLNNATVLAATNMTYTAGPPAIWTYAAAASLFLPGQSYLVVCRGWDSSLATLYSTRKIALSDGG